MTAEPGPATYSTEEREGFTEAMGPPPTVGQLLEQLRAFLVAKEGDESYRPEWRAGVEAHVAELERRDPKMYLLRLAEALEGDLLTDEQKFLVRWQHASHLHLDGFERGLLQALTLADDFGQLERLALSFPVEVAALRAWRSDPECAPAMRRLPLHFSL